MSIIYIYTYTRNSTFTNVFLQVQLLKCIYTDYICTCLDIHMYKYLCDMCVCMHKNTYFFAPLKKSD